VFLLEDGTELPLFNVVDALLLFVLLPDPLPLLLPDPLTELFIDGGFILFPL